MPRRPAILSYDDAEYLAHRRLPKSLYEMIRQGSEQEVTLRANLRAYDDYEWVPRAAVHAPTRDTSTTVLGHRIAFPAMIAPTGRLRTQHSSGEPAAARAAGRAGIIHIVSCFMGYPIEDVVAAASGPVFFNLYLAGGRPNAERMIERAKSSGCAALVITVDWAAAQQKARSVRDRVDTPAGLDLRSIARFAPQLWSKPRWLLDFVRDGIQFDAPMWQRESGQSATWWEMGQSILTSVPVWSDLEWIRKIWDGPIVFKGIMTVDDAKRAVDAGLDAIVVSNHGGRSLDGLPSTLSVLPSVVDAIGDSLEVYFDGGIRRGSDIVKAVALGARACLIGRPVTFAHAALGERGVTEMLAVLQQGVELTLGSLGRASIQEVDRDSLRLATADELATRRGVRA